MPLGKEYKESEILKGLSPTLRPLVQVLDGNKDNAKINTNTDYCFIRAQEQWVLVYIKKEEKKVQVEEKAQQAQIKPEWKAYCFDPEGLPLDKFKLEWFQQFNSVHFFHSWFVDPKRPDEKGMTGDICLQLAERVAQCGITQAIAMQNVMDKMAGKIAINIGLGAVPKFTVDVNIPLDKLDRNWRKSPLHRQHSNIQPDENFLGKDLFTLFVPYGQKKANSDLRDTALHKVSSSFGQYLAADAASQVSSQTTVTSTTVAAPARQQSSHTRISKKLEKNPPVALSAVKHASEQNDDGLQLSKGPKSQKDSTIVTSTTVAAPVVQQGSKTTTKKTGKTPSVAPSATKHGSDDNDDGSRLSKGSKKQKDSTIVTSTAVETPVAQQSGTKKPEENPVVVPGTATTHATPVKTVPVSTTVTSTAVATFVSPSQEYKATEMLERLPSTLRDQAQVLDGNKENAQIDPNIPYSFIHVNNQWVLAYIDIKKNKAYCFDPEGYPLYNFKPEWFEKFKSVANSTLHFFYSKFINPMDLYGEGMTGAICLQLAERVQKYGIDQAIATQDVMNKRAEEIATKLGLKTVIDQAISTQDDMNKRAEEIATKFGLKAVLELTDNNPNKKSIDERWQQLSLHRQYSNIQPDKNFLGEDLFTLLIPFGVYYEQGEKFQFRAEQKPLQISLYSAQRKDFQSRIKALQNIKERVSVVTRDCSAAEIHSEGSDANQALSQTTTTSTTVTTPVGQQGAPKSSEENPSVVLSAPKQGNNDNEDSSELSQGSKSPKVSPISEEVSAASNTKDVALLNDLPSVSNTAQESSIPVPIAVISPVVALSVKSVSSTELSHNNAISVIPRQTSQAQSPLPLQEEANAGNVISQNIDQPGSTKAIRQDKTTKDQATQTLPAEAQVTAVSQNPLETQVVDPSLAEIARLVNSALQPVAVPAFTEAELQSGAMSQQLNQRLAQLKGLQQQLAAYMETLRQRAAPQGGSSHATIESGVHASEASQVGVDAPESSQPGVVAQAPTIGPFYLASQGSTQNQGAQLSISNSDWGNSS